MSEILGRLEERDFHRFKHISPNILTMLTFCKLIKSSQVINKYILNYSIVAKIEQLKGCMRPRLPVM